MLYHSQIMVMLLLFPNSMIAAIALIAAYSLGFTLLLQHYGLATYQVESYHSAYWTR